MALIVAHTGRLTAAEDARIAASVGVEVRNLYELNRLDQQYGRPGAPQEVAAAADELDRLLADAEAILLWTVPRNLMRRAPKLRWIQFAWAGVDMLRRAGVLDHPVTIATGSGIAAHAIAEWTLGAIFALAKNFPHYVRLQDQHKWGRVAADDVAGKTLAVYGLGAIGSELARIAAGVGMRVIATRRSRTGLTPQGVEALYGPEGLETIMREADYFVIAAPLTAETRKTIGEEQLGWLKPGTRLINVSRGEIVDEEALIVVLRSGHLAGAALDVFEREPLPAESPLWEIPSVIVSPHISASTPDYQTMLVDRFVENLTRYSKGEPLLFEYRQDRGY